MKGDDYAEFGKKLFYFQAGPDCRPVPPSAGRSLLPPPSVLLPGTGPWTQADYSPHLAQGLASAAGTRFPSAFERTAGDPTERYI